MLTYVFKGFLKFCERGQTGFDDAVGPLADLGVSVPVASDRALDRFLDDVGNLIHHELGLKKVSNNIDNNVYVMSMKPIQSDHSPWPVS